MTNSFLQNDKLVLEAIKIETSISIYLDITNE